MIFEWIASGCKNGSYISCGYDWETVFLQDFFWYQSLGRLRMLDAATYKVIWVDP